MLNFKTTSHHKKTLSQSEIQGFENLPSLCNSVTSIIKKNNNNNSLKIEITVMSAVICLWRSVMKTAGKRRRWILCQFRKWWNIKSRLIKHNKTIYCKFSIFKVALFIFVYLYTCTHESDRLSGCCRCSYTIPSILSEVTRSPKTIISKTNHRPTPLFDERHLYTEKLCNFQSRWKRWMLWFQQPEAWSPSTDSNKDPGDLR